MSAVPSERARILLVDDSMLMRKAASKMLGEEFDVVTAVDGEDAWAKIQADNSIQVVFTDLSMPKVDGYGLLRFVRGAEDEGTLNLPVIVVTSADDHDDGARKKALDQGATDFITKPFSSIDLLARARAHANYRRIARRLEQQITLDALTGLANKAGFLDRMLQDIALSRRLAQPLTVARIEIDDFRNVFLTHGKQRAEALVRHVAQALHERVRKEDTAARLGLAGFALALPGGAHVGSKGLLERVRSEFAATPFTGDGNPIRFSVSIAVTTPALDPEPTVAGLLDACEQLLQAALRAGGNRVLGDVADVPGVVDALELVPEAAVALPARAEPVAPATPAPADAAPKAKAAPVPAPAASSATESQTSPPVAVVSIDQALGRIERGEAQSVLGQLPQLIQRLVPLLRALSARQRGQLVAFLQKLGT
jgi:two-component system cell cycle response regulator